MLTHSDYRYSKVQTIIESYSAKEVCDLGCGPGKFLKRLTRNSSISKLIGIDVSKSDLSDAKWELMPDTFDYVLKKERINGLQITLYQASILKSLDKIAGLKEIEYFTLIEVIEHLHFEELKIFAANIFGRLNPSIIVITTPNKEYNVNYNPSSTRLRHPDHKFEFTQQEFQEWCSSISSEYNYSYLIEGVGKYHSESPESRGYCTQICTFSRKNDKNDIKSLSNKLKIEDQDIIEIERIDYPSAE